MLKEKIKEILKERQKLDEICKVAWSGVDTNNTGYIDEYEMGTVINSVLMEIGFYETPLEVDKALHDFKAKDHKIEENDFKEFIKNVLNEIVHSNSD